MAFTWGQNLIKVVNNFATPEECKLLSDYLDTLPDFSSKSVAWLEFIPGEHDKEIKIENEKVASLMHELNKRTHDYIVETYFPEAELEIISDNGNRELELIRWSNNSGLDAHSDWREPDGSPHPLTLPAFTLGSLIYLNKEYSGGHISFPEYDFFLDPQPGDLILFPCQYLHAVTEVSTLPDKEVARRYTMPVFYWFDLKAKED